MRPPVMDPRQARARSQRCTLVLFTALALISGCTSFDRPVLDEWPDQPQYAPDAVLDPIVGGRYEIAPEQEVIGELQVVRARYEDTFVDIARAYGLGFDELVAANPAVDPWLPGADTLIVLPTQFVLPRAPRTGLVLNIAAKRLFFYPPVEAGESAVVETYPIGIGRTGWATPTGATTVVAKARDPVWFVPASVRREHAEAGDPLPAQVPAGPDNPLGRYVLGLGLPGYLIHGTNKPAGVGMRVSHGCVRLFPENIEALYGRVPVGTPVRLVDQPYLFGLAGEDLVLEAHTPLEEDDRDWQSGLVQQARARLVGADVDPASIDKARIGQIVEEARGFPVSVFGRRPDTAATIRAARPVENIVEHGRVADGSID